MGHLVRCKEIISSLVKEFEVCFVSGGQAVPGFQLPPEAEVVYLPAIWQQGADLLPVDPTLSLAVVKAQRTELLLAVFDRFQPDCLITECFPFSKMSMKYELNPLLKRAKESARPVKILCSLRDLIMTQPLFAGAKERREAKVCRLINRFYDAVLFHSDAGFQRLEDCFSRVSDLNCEIFYTGYVAQSAPAEQSPTPDDIAGLSNPLPSIVASAGGGRHGYPLLSAIIAASPRLGNVLPHHIYVFAGPFMPDADFAQLQQAAAGRPNVTLRRYTSLLLNYLKKADLSVSLGGYNTTMNLLRTGVPSLIFPSPNLSQTDEQRLRAEKLANLGVVDLLTPEELAPETLTQIIQATLERQSFTAHQINLQGADNTANYIQKLLSVEALLTQAV
ncbi:glycosyltransferase family protein [Leptothoe sp. PORK10 BA2]|uniref:glycosyltransferase family protein n=1 Tax=Leptothoe sp. PORK10 BA2 TaxID=3110254 RepID=UPI002B1FECD6|nr:glycosyltransferase [Leptothoe sp. PORK10 BA2]MEA5466829.1 glycosyltransferase [Leptothoe sp. PORK10 BA2]